MMPDLMQDVSALEVPARSIALWFLGQNGWIVKSPGGTVIAVDPYLSDACKGRRPNLDQARQVPILVPPELLNVDLFLCTHSHVDHACPITIAGSYKAGTRRFGGPAETQLVFERCGIPGSERILTWPNQRFDFADLCFTGTFALPTDGSDLTHMGFVVEVADGPRFYITGDTAETDLVKTAKRHAPHLMAVCINAGFKNLSHWQAAELVRDIDPEIAIPCHFDMFPDNSCPPHMFRASLAVLGIEEKYRLLKPGEVFVYSAGK
jgi:L-ascorbate 6-phosphate lactonase